MGVLGGWLIGVVFIGVNDGAFWSQMRASVDFRYDVWNGVVKSFVFGVAVSLIAVFEGYDSVPTAEGVPGAITRTVVTSALAILALDFVLTSFMFRGTSSRSVTDLWVGIFVAIGIAALLFFGAEGGESFHCSFVRSAVLTAKFDNIGGLKVRGRSKRRGRGRRARSTDIGSIARPTKPVVTLKIDQRYRFPKDTFASILTSGLPGEQYVGLPDAGGDEKMLNAGDGWPRPSRRWCWKMISQFLFQQGGGRTGKEMNGI